MRKIFLAVALCAMTLVANAATYNYLCAITDLTIDTLQSNTKNQFTLNWTQKCKNIAEYSTKPNTTYTTTVKLVLNSDDRTLEGVYTTEGASPTSSSANVNDQTINLVTSELYYGSTRRLLRTDSISTFTIIKVDDTHYGISIGRLCFTAAALADRNKNTYNYNLCYAEEDILTQGIEPTPYVFGYTGEYEQAVYNYDMTVNGISVLRDDSEYGAIRYFLTLSCVGKNRDTNAERNYEVQLAIYPDEASIVGTYATQGGNLLYSSNSYVKDLKINKTRYLANDSISSIQIKSKGAKQYSFYGGTLICTDIDANYMAVYGKKRIEAVHYYHFSDNDGQGIPFGYDETSTEIELTANNIAIESTIDGLELTLQTTDVNNVAYTVYLILDSESLAGTFTYTSGLSAWSKVERGTISSSYVASGATVTINAKGNNAYTISGSLLCENGNTYILKAYDFNNGTVGFDQITNDKSPMTNKVIRDGQLIIINDGKIFNAQGAQLQ